jgi:hypothetical protein
VNNKIQAKQTPSHLHLEQYSEAIKWSYLQALPFGFPDPWHKLYGHPSQVNKLTEKWKPQSVLSRGGNHGAIQSRSSQKWPVEIQKSTSFAPSLSSHPCITSHHFLPRYDWTNPAKVKSDISWYRNHLRVSCMRLNSAIDGPDWKMWRDRECHQLSECCELVRRRKRVQLSLQRRVKKPGWFSSRCLSFLTTLLAGSWNPEMFVWHCCTIALDSLTWYLIYTPGFLFLHLKG